MHCEKKPNKIYSCLRMSGIRRALNESGQGPDEGEDRSMKKSAAAQVAFGGMIAALYVVLTYFAAVLNLANGAIQVRFSEALTILPVFTPAAIPGLAVGCVLANLITGCAVWDVVFGSLATLIGAAGTWLLRKRPYIAWIPPVLSNMAIIPVVLMKVYGVDQLEVFGYTAAGGSVWGMLVLTIGIGEILSCGVLGLLLYHSVKRIPQLRHL